MNLFCHQCGKKLGKDDTFCQSCGAKVESDTSEVRHETPKASLHGLEKKAWYRAVKVVYVLVVGICVLSTVGIAYAVMPEREIDDDKSLIVCNNGNVYAPGENLIYIYGDGLDDTDSKHARILCKYDTTAYYSSQFYNENIPLNYTFKPSYIEPDYASWLGGVLLAVFIQAAILLLIRMAFFYIAIGVKPKFDASIFRL